MNKPCEVFKKVLSKGNIRIKLLGDSITQGANAEKDSQSFAWLLTRYFDFESYNFGVGGIRFQPETVEDVGIDPELVFIALGTNNFGSNRPLELLQENCRLNCFMDIARLMPIVADARLAEILQLTPGTPLLYIEEVDYDVDGKPILYSRQYFVTDYFQHNIIRKRL